MFVWVWCVGLVCECVLDECVGVQCGLSGGEIFHGSRIFLKWIQKHFQGS